MLKRDRRARSASDEDKQENVRRRASQHSDQYRQSDIDIQKSRTLKRSRRARRASDEDEKEDVRRRASQHSDQYAQLGIYIEVSKSRGRDHLTNENMLQATETDSWVNAFTHEDIAQSFT